MLPSTNPKEILFNALFINHFTGNSKEFISDSEFKRIQTRTEDLGVHHLLKFHEKDKTIELESLNDDTLVMQNALLLKAKKMDKIHYIFKPSRKNTQIAVDFLELFVINLAKGKKESDEKVIKKIELTIRHLEALAGILSGGIAFPGKDYVSLILNNLTKLRTQTSQLKTAQFRHEIQKAEKILKNYFH